MIDEASGDTFYYNNITGETSWNNPFAESVDMMATSAAPSERDEWIVCFDEASGANFYINKSKL